MRTLVAHSDFKFSLLSDCKKIIPCFTFKYLPNYELRRMTAYPGTRTAVLPKPIHNAKCGKNNKMALLNSHSICDFTLFLSIMEA